VLAKGIGWQITRPANASLSETKTHYTLFIFSFKNGTHNITKLQNEKYYN
jgi:hypothetical protein